MPNPVHLTPTASDAAVLDPATPQTTPRTAKPNRSRVVHLRRLAAVEAARAMGLSEVPAACGRAWASTAPAPELYRTRRDGVTTIHNLPATVCKVCLAIYKRATGLA